MKMIKRFLGYYKPHVKIFSLDLVAAVIIAMCNLFYPSVTKEIINNYVPNQLLSNLIFAAVILLAVYIVKAFCTHFMSYQGHIMGIRMQQDMRRDLFEKYQRLPTSYFDDHKTGDLLSRLVNDLFEVSELAHHGPENLLLAILMLVGSFVMLCRIDMTLTLILFATIPFTVFFAIISRRGMRLAMKDSRKQTAVINSTLENSIGGVRETKSYAAEHYEMEKFSSVNSLYAKIRGRAMFSMANFEMTMALVSDLLHLLIILIGGIFFFNGRIDAGEFTAFVLYIGMFLTPIQKFVALFQQLEEGMTGFSRFCDILDEPEQTDTGSIVLDDVKGEVCFNSVTFAYTVSEEDGTPKNVISNLSLKIEAGKTLALVGPSGSGKSTLCHLIPRFYEISSGSITLDGIDIRDIKLESLRRSIGIVSQNVFLFDGSIRDNIAYGTPDASEEQIIEAAKRANIHSYVETLELGYSTPVGKRGIKLSGGQRQRIAIARVFLKNPSLLILDEATSALDNATEMQVQAALEELSVGRTVIVVAHRLSTVKNADVIVVIDKGGIVEQGSHEQLLAVDGEYKKLYSYQFKNISYD